MDLRTLSNAALLKQLTQLLERQRGVEANLLYVLGEVDRRRLYLECACNSMFAYCTEVLKMSENAAYRRIHVSRAARRYPLVLTMLSRGELHLSGASKLVPHLTEENHRRLLSFAKHKTTRQIDELLAQAFPKPDVRTSIRKLPTKRVNEMNLPRFPDTNFESCRNL